jgi:hypothetical protein
VNNCGASKFKGLLRNLAGTMDIRADRPTDRHLPGARQHRDPQPERQRRPHERVQADARVDLDDPAVGIDAVDTVQRGHVDHQDRKSVV